jgi:hypothetical protein
LVEARADDLYHLYLSEKVCKLLYEYYHHRLARILSVGIHQNSSSEPAVRGAGDLLLLLAADGFSCILS